MKKITILLLFFIILSCDKKTTLLDFPCESLFMEEKDEFENQVMYKGHKLLLNNESEKTIGNLEILSLDLKKVFINMSIEDRLCVDENTKVILLFDDGTTRENFIENDVNCEGSMLFSNPSLLYEFKYKLLKGFRVKTIDGYIDYYLSNDSKLELQKISACFFDIALEKQKSLQD